MDEQRIMQVAPPNGLLIWNEILNSKILCWMAKDGVIHWWETFSLGFMRATRNPQQPPYIDTWVRDPFGIHLLNFLINNAVMKIIQVK